MALLPVFPQLAGQGWSVHKRPIFSTRVAGHVSGREVRSALYTAPLYEFTLSFEGLASTGGFAGLGAFSLQSLLGFVLQCRGQYGTFLYVDPTDSVATNQPIAVGDGAATTFPVVRTIGSFTEPVGVVTQLAAVTVGGAAAQNWSLAAPATLVFASPPEAGAAVAASFTYAFLCRFIEDVQDFENVAAGLWQVPTLRFRSVRA